MTTLNVVRDRHLDELTATRTPGLGVRALGGELPRVWWGGRLPRGFVGPRAGSVLCRSELLVGSLRVPSCIEVG
jgi:hypothetical protein